MIDVAISYGFGDDNRYNLKDIPPDIQLATFKTEPLIANKDKIIDSLEKAKTNVKVVHLPLDILKQEPDRVLELIFIFNQKFRCQHFVIHPNKMIESFIDYYLQNRKYKGIYDYKLCIETFQWRKKKKIRSPLDIMEYCIRYPEISMCIDTSHIETLWFEHKIMSKLLKYTSIIHLSNRAKGYGSHIPFNSSYGELNLIRFVKQLKNIYKWNGIIILEYMNKYQDKLIKNYRYIKKLLE